MSRARFDSISARAARSASSRRLTSSWRSAAASAARGPGRRRRARLRRRAPHSSRRRDRSPRRRSRRSQRAGRIQADGALGAQARGVEIRDDDLGMPRRGRASGGCDAATDSARISCRNAKLLPEPKGPTSPTRNGVCASGDRREIDERRRGFADAGRDRPSRRRRDQHRIFAAWTAPRPSKARRFGSCGCGQWLAPPRSISRAIIRLFDFQLALFCLALPSGFDA